MKKENKCKEKDLSRLTVYGVDITVNNIDKDVVKQKRKRMLGLAVLDVILFGLNTAAAVLIIKNKDELGDQFESGIVAGANIMAAGCSVCEFISDMSTIHSLRELEKCTVDTVVEEVKNIEPTPTNEPTVDDPDLIPTT